jgi:flagellar biogenesis protein FliO
MKVLKAWVLAGGVLLAAGMGAARAQDAASPASQPASGAPSIPFRREPVAAADTAYRTFAALVVVLALGGLAVYVLHARGKGGGSLLLPAGAGKVQVVESRRLGAKGMLVVVRWNAEELLLSHGEGGTTLIARAPAPPATASGERA